MIELHEWIESAPFDDRPWLVIGKGPSFERRGEFDLDGFHTMSLNHVVQQLPVDLAHIMDLDVVEACADALRTNCRYLVMPRRPHVAQEPSRYRLEDFFDAVPVLKELDDQGRLVWYSASMGRVPEATEHVPVRYFSAEAAIAIVGALGGRDVRTLGIDGGTQYGGTFDHLRGVTLFANGRPSFDLQFAEIEKTRRRYGMRIRPLVSPLRVFVGAAERDLPAMRTLAHSIGRHTSVPVQVLPLTGIPMPLPKRRENRPRTPFSFARFAIPGLCGYEGRAVYLDSDMLVFEDIAELARLPFGTDELLCSRQDEGPKEWAGSQWFQPGRQFSVMVLDCDRLDWDVDDIVAGLDEGRYSYRELLFGMRIVPEERVGETVPAGWNHLEHYEPGVTRLLHYTNVPTQPWRSDANPLGHLWEAAYREAVHAGAVPWAEVEPLVRSGEVKPALAEAFEDAPGAETKVTGDAVTMELRAVRAELDTLRRRTWKGRVRGGLEVGWPMVRRVRDRRPGSRLSVGADRLHEFVKARL